MKLKRSVKMGLAVILIYSIVTTCLLMTADRIERLEREDFRNTNTSVSIKFGK